MAERGEVGEAEGALIVQEGGYLTRTLGVNARNFLQGIWEGAGGKMLP